MRLRPLRQIVSLCLALLVAAAALGAPAARPVLAAPSLLVVNRTDDVAAANACAGNPNDCSLRGAVQKANANPGSTIRLTAPLVYLLSDTASGELILTATTTITADISLCVGTCYATIQGGPAWPDRLLQVQPGATIAADHIKLTNGHDSNGGALLNYGTLTLTTGDVFSNTALGWGGGILNYGTLTLSNTVVNGNQALTTGGAIANQADAGKPGTVIIVNSQIVTNSVTGPSSGQGDGGGISSFNNISGTIHPLLTINNSSLLTNTGTITGFGGGLYVDGNTSLTNVTLQGNSAAGGGGAYVHFGQLTMQGGSVLSNLALTSGGSGGGFRNDGQLSLSGVLLDGNQAQGGGSGGGLSSSSALTVTDSIFTHNSAGNSGGAVFLAGPGARLLLSHGTLLSNNATYGGALAGFGTLTVTAGSHLNGNTAFQGGALNIFGGGSALVTGGSQIVNNQTSGGAPGTSFGAGIFNGGRLQIQSASLSGNFALNGGGAGLYNGPSGQASLAGADLVGNQAQDGAGGAVASLGTLTITTSALISNTSLAQGGAISNTGGLSLANTTLSHNSATGSGGGLFNNGQAQLSFVTIAANTSAAGQGGGLANTGALTLSDTLLASNSGVPADCTGSVTSLGYNLIANAAGCTLVGPGTGDRRNVNAKITPLIDQGGVLRYHDLLFLSPAIDAADPTPGVCPAVDQRGVARPIGPRCDIGAIESSSLPFYELFLPLARR